jgi:TonB family protein
MNSLLFSGICFLLGLVSVESPTYPLNAVRGGTVVAVLESVNGSVADVRILWGEEPFLSSSRSALEKWRFDSKEKNPVLAVVQFRHPELFFPNTNKVAVPPRPSPDGLPYPTGIVQPDYPSPVQNGGSVVLQAEISDRGEVTDPRVIRPLGSFTDTALEALKQWTFRPARNSAGEPVPSRVYAVMVFRVPVTAPGEK